jgi:plastocyanin
MIIRNLFPAMALLVFLACLVSLNAHAQSPNEIEIRDFPYKTDALTVPFGTNIIWVNDDTTDHTVTSDDGIFHSGYLGPGEQFSYLFDRPGNYPYHCEIHPSEKGVIQVTSEPYNALFTKSSVNPSAVSKPASAKQYTHDQKQVSPYPQYEAYTAQGNTLWIQGTTGRAQYATVRQGERLSLIAIASAEGDGYLYEKYPDGRTVKSDYHFLQSSNEIGFNADTIGQHVLSFSIGNQVSNSIVIDVVDHNAPSYQEPSYQQQVYKEPSYQQQAYQETSYKQQGYQKQSYQQPSYQQQVYKEPSYQQQVYKEPSYQQQVYKEPSYQQQVYQETSYRPQSVPPAKGPSTEYSAFWDKSAIKLDSSGRLTYIGLQGTDYNLQPSNTNVLTRGLFYNGVSYILVANPSSVSNTVIVNPQMSNWNMPNVQVMYGNLMAAKIENLLQITAPAYQSGLIIIQPAVQPTVQPITQPQRVQKKRYSFTIGPKPPSSFKSGLKKPYSSTGGVKPPYSFSAGPKQPYSFRIGY